MAKVQKRTFSLPEDQSAYIDAKVAAGGYASSSEVVREGLRALQEKDALIERWLQEEVVPSYDKWVADGRPTRSSDEVFADLEARIKSRAARKAT
jgi:antitoxin ParD1/3/4